MIVIDASVLSEAMHQRGAFVVKAWRVTVAQIAATCLVHDATLATRNTMDFDGRGLKLLDPWATLMPTTVLHRATVRP